ncbi:hypothetical protein E2320_013176, partial [Naja naja]
MSAKQVLAHGPGADPHPPAGRVRPPAGARPTGLSYPRARPSSATPGGPTEARATRPESRRGRRGEPQTARRGELRAELQKRRRHRRLFARTPPQGGAAMRAHPPAHPAGAGARERSPLRSEEEEEGAAATGPAEAPPPSPASPVCQPAACRLGMILPAERPSAAQRACV